MIKSKINSYPKLLHTELKPLFVNCKWKFNQREKETFYALPITSLEGLKADITALPELCLLGKYFIFVLQSAAEQSEMFNNAKTKFV